MAADGETLPASSKAQAGAAPVAGAVEAASADSPELLVKLCGMRTEADVAGAASAGCDFAGFVVEVPGKRRSVSQEQLAALSAKLPAGVRSVGVFVNAPVEAVHRLLAEGVIDAAQLHGDENDAYIARLRQLLAEDDAGEAEAPAAARSGRPLPPEQPAQPAASTQSNQLAAARCGQQAGAAQQPAAAQPGQPMPATPGTHAQPMPATPGTHAQPTPATPGTHAQPPATAPRDPRAARIIQAFRIRGHDDIAAAAASAADLVLLDSGAGSGKPFDWQLLEGFPRPFLLAGGLGPDNLAQAIAQARQAAGANLVGVDMSSGIETDYVKDPLKMKAAVAAAKGANR